MIEVVGLITARGGSKGIPRKNIKRLAGKPLIAWTIEAARQSRHLRRLILSTDDDEIAQTAREWGADVPFMRPGELARDDSSHISVVRHAADWLERNESRCPEFLMILQPPTPLRTAADIDGAIELANEKGADAVVSVVEAQHHPYLTHRMTETGSLVEFVPCDIEYPRRQDLPPVYALNGAIYLIRYSRLPQLKTLVPHGSLGFVMPQDRSLDIDTLWDFHLAELILQHQPTQAAVRPHEQEHSSR